MEYPRCVPFNSSSDDCCRSFLDALLPQLPQLGALAAAGASRLQRGVLTQLLGRLLALAPQACLSVSQPSFYWLLDAYQALLANRSVDKFRCSR